MRDLQAVMDEVDRRSDNWGCIHRNMHQRRVHPQCPWCGEGKQ